MEFRDAPRFEPGEHLKELVQCAEPSGHENKPDAVFDETTLREKK